MTTEIKNAIIESTTLTLNEGHGIPSCMIHLNYGGSSQGFGGYDLRYYGLKMITSILETVGEERWEYLPGNHVRARIEGGLIVAIGHIMEDKWYYPKAEDKKQDGKDL